MKQTPSPGDGAQRAGVSAAMVSRIGRGQLSVDAAHHARLRRAAAEFSLRLDQRHNETSTQSGRRRRGYSAARSILSLREPVTAIFVIGVAGFNDTEAALRHPPLTSVAEFPEELGRHLEVLRAQPY